MSQIPGSRRALIVVAAMAVLLLVGTAGYRLIEGMSAVDAFYMTIITISTVGFGEVKTLTTTGRLFTIVLIVGGAGLLAYAASATVEFFTSGEWQMRLAQRRRQQMLAQLKDHCIVCGYGRVGRHVAQELQREGLPFVILDTNPERVAHAQSEGHLAVTGNAANETILQEAGIARARHLVAAVASDAENVFIVLTARSLQPNLLIVARANYEESEPKLLRAGADRVITPYSISGRRMVSLLLRPDVADFLDEVMHSSGLELFLEQFTLAPQSTLVGQTLAQVQLRNTVGVTVLACKPPHERLITAPGPETPLPAGVRLIVLGTREQLQVLSKLAAGEAESV